MCAQITEISVVSPTQTAATKRMDYIENFKSELEGAKNAQSIALIIDNAFKSLDFMHLDPNDMPDLLFSYQDCLLGSSNLEVPRSSSYAAALL